MNDYCIENDFAAQKELAAYEEHHNIIRQGKVQKAELEVYNLTRNESY